MMPKAWLMKAKTTTAIRRVTKCIREIFPLFNCSPYLGTVSLSLFASLSLSGTGGLSNSLCFKTWLTFSWKTHPGIDFGLVCHGMGGDPAELLFWSGFFLLFLDVRGVFVTFSIGPPLDRQFSCCFYTCWSFRYRPTAHSRVLVFFFGQIPPSIEPAIPLLVFVLYTPQQKTSKTKQQISLISIVISLSGGKYSAGGVTQWITVGRSEFHEVDIWSKIGTRERATWYWGYQNVWADLQAPECLSP